MERAHARVGVKLWRTIMPNSLTTAVTSLTLSGRSATHDTRAQTRAPRDAVREGDVWQLARQTARATTHRGTAPSTEQPHVDRRGRRTNERRNFPTIHRACVPAGRWGALRSPRCPAPTTDVSRRRVGVPTTPRVRRATSVVIAMYVHSYSCICMCLCRKIVCRALPAYTHSWQ